MEYRTSAHNDRVRRITQLAKLSCNHPSVVLTADVFPFLCHNKTQTLRPMTMETRCCKVFFPNYSKMNSVEDTLVPPLWRKRAKHPCFLYCLFTLLHAAEIVLSLWKLSTRLSKTAHATIGLWSRHRTKPPPTRYVTGKATVNVDAVSYTHLTLPTKA